MKDSPGRDGPGEDVLLKERRYGRLADHAYERIKADIESGAIEPGSVVFEAELVNRFRMSRTPIREAVHRLRSEGYLTQLHRGYRVVELSDHDLANVYRVRGVLEGMAARQAAYNKSRVDIAILEDIIERAEQAINRNDEASARQLSEEFHEAVSRASNNDYLQSTLKSTRTFVEPYRSKMVSADGMSQRVLEEHKAILEAIRSGDGDAAEFTAREHMRRSLRQLVGLPIDSRPPEPI